MALLQGLFTLNIFFKNCTFPKSQRLFNLIFGPPNNYQNKGKIEKKKKWGGGLLELRARAV